MPGAELRSSARRHSSARAPLTHLLDHESPPGPRRPSESFPSSPGRSSSASDHRASRLSAGTSRSRAAVRRLAAGLLLVAAFLSSGGTAAQAQTTLVSNTGQNNSGAKRADSDEIAQAFGTGSDMAGYDFDSIVLSLGFAPTGTGTLTVTVREDASGDPSGTALYTLTTPDPIAGGSLNTFAAPADATLDANTTYWVVASYSSDTGGPNWWRTLLSNGIDDAGAAGWTIDSPYKTDSRTSPNGWSEDAPDRALKLQVKGTAKGTFTQTAAGATWTLTGETSVAAGGTYTYTLTLTSGTKPLNEAAGFHLPNTADNQDKLGTDPTDCTSPEQFCISFTGGSSGDGIWDNVQGHDTRHITLHDTSPHTLTATFAVAADAPVGSSIEFGAIQNNGLPRDDGLTITVDATATLSTDATLSALTVNDGTTEHTINLATTPYTVDVGNAVTSVTLTATPTHTGASVSAVTLGGTAIADTDFTDGITVPSLAEGDNEIVVTVTAEDGSATETYTVTVTREGTTNTVPGAPTSLTATASGTSTIDLDWTAPSSDGGSAITGYRIEVSPNGTSSWSDAVTNTGSTSTNASYTGLSAGTTRHYRVSAINSVGTGAASNVDDATTDDAVVTPTETEVAADWDLKPSGLSSGDKFRLLFITSTPRNAVPTAIADYNTFVQNRAAAGHTNIQSHSSGFRAVGSTEDVDARDNTSTTYTSSDTGVPIYWLDGNKVVDDYEDFYDGSWDEETTLKNESGNTFTATSSTRVWTGSDHDGTEYFSPSTGVSVALGRNPARVGAPNNSSTHSGPLTGTGSSGANLANTTQRRFYGLSSVFVVGDGTTLSTDATLSALTVNDGTTEHTINLATTPYTVDVGNAVTTVTLTATPTHTGASVSAVTLGGTAIADTDFTDGITVPSLAEGDNVIDVTVTAEDGSTTETYTVTVTREATTVPGAPTSLTATASGTSTINLTWTAPADNGGSPITGYRIEVSPNGTSGWTDREADTGTATTTYAHTGLSAGTTRHYRVSAINSVGTGAASNVDDATTDDAATTAPAIVTDGVEVTSTPATGDTYRLGETIGITVTFDNAVTVNPGAVGPPRIQFRLTGSLERWADYSSGSGGTALVFTYEVQSGDMDDDGIFLPGSHIRLRTDGTITAAADNTVAAILAYDAPGLQPDHKVNGSTVPGAPTSLTATASGTSTIDLDWTAPSSDGGSAITGYRIEVSPNGTSSWSDLVADTDETTTTYSHIGLSAGTTRHYRVSAINANGTGDASNVDNATTDAAAATVPGAPTGLTATASGTSTINLDWDAPSNDGGASISGYRIEVSSNSGTSWTNREANTGSSSTSYSHDQRLQDRGLLQQRNQLDQPRGQHRQQQHQLLPHRPFRRHHPPLPRLGDQLGRHRRRLQRRRRHHRRRRRHRARHPDRPHGNGQRDQHDQPRLDRAVQRRRLRHHRLQDRGFAQWQLELEQPRGQHRQHQHQLRPHRPFRRHHPPLPRLGHQLGRHRRRLQRRRRHHRQRHQQGAAGADR